MEKKKIFSLRKTTMGVGSLAIATTLIFGGGEILPGIEGPAHVQAAVESAKNIEINPTQIMQKGSVVSVDNFDIKPDEERSTGGFVDTELSLTIKNPQPGENFSLRLAVPLKNLETGEEELKYYNFVANIEGDIKDVDGNVIGTTSGNTITLSEAVKDAEEVKVNMSASSYIKLIVDSEDDKGEGTYGIGVHAIGSKEGASFLAYNKDFKHTNIEFLSKYNYTMGIPVLRASSYEKYPSGQGAYLLSGINIKGSELINEYNVSKKGDYFTISYHIPDGAYKEDGELYYGLNPESDVDVKLRGKTHLALDGLGDVETFFTSEIDNPFEVERLSASDSEIVYKFTLTEDLDSVEKESQKRYAFRGGNLLDFAKLVEEFKGEPKVLEPITSGTLRFKEEYAPSFKITDQTGEVEKILNQPKIETTQGTIESFLKHAENPPAPNPEQNCDCDALIEKTDEKIAELNKLIEQLNADKGANKDLIDKLTERVEKLEVKKTELVNLIKGNKANIEELDGKIGDLKEALDETNQSITDAEKRLNDRINESNTKIENLNKDLQTEKDKLNNLRDDFEALKKEHADDKAAYEKEKERLIKEITTIKDNINTITDELLDLGIETERQAKEIESLKSNLDAAKEDIDTLLELLVELEANHKDDVDTILDLLIELEDKLNGAIDSSKAVQDAQQKDIDALKEQLEALKTSDKETKQEIEKLQAVLDALKSQGDTDVNININNNNEVVITEADKKADVEAEVEAPEEEVESEDNKDDDKQTDDSKDAGEDSDDKDSDDKADNSKEESEDKINQPSDDKNINVDNNNTVTTDKDNTDKDDGAYDGDNIEKPDAPAEDKNDSKDVADKDDDAKKDSDKDSGIGLANNDINKDNKSDDINKDGINKNGVLPDTGAPIAIGGIGALLVTALGALGFRRFKNKDEE